MKPETRFWKRVNANLPRVGDRLDRVENSIGSGIPDVNGCFERQDFWIELKAPIEPKKENSALFGSNHKVLTSQQNWFERQRQAGGVGLLLIGTDKRIMLLDGTRYATTDDINHWCVAEIFSKSIFHESVPTPVEKWGLLRNAIIAAARYRRDNKAIRRK